MKVVNNNRDFINFLQINVLDFYLKLRMMQKNLIKVMMIIKEILNLSKNLLMHI